VVIGIAINVGCRMDVARSNVARVLRNIGRRRDDGGLSTVHRASVYNVERFIGWVTTAAQFEAACRTLANGAS
jgi:hypothetical protein